MPRWLILPAISVLTLLAIFVLFSILVRTTGQIIDQQDFLLSRLNDKLEYLLAVLKSRTGMNLDQGDIFRELREFFNLGVLSRTAGGVARTVGAFTGSFVMFAIYYIVFLSGLSDYKRFLYHVGGRKKGALLVANYEVIRNSVSSYIIIKTLVSVATGFLVMLLCWIFDVKFALFFGFLAFILNFIPSVGSIIATVPPVLMLIIQSDSFGMVAVLLALLIVVQNVMGNYVEPKVLGNRLRLNTFTVIFGLVFWGYIWGIPGMMLSVPLMVILKLVLEQTNGTEMVARMMGSPDNKKHEV